MMPQGMTLSDRLAFDVQGTENLRAKAKSGDAEALRTTAREFESMVVGMMLKTMRQTRFDDTENELFGGQAMQMYRDMLDQQWARKVTEKNGFGLSDMLMRQFKLQQKLSAADAATGAKPETPQVNQPAPQLNQVSPTDSAAQVGGTGLSGMQAVSANPSDAARQFMARLRPHADAAAQRLGVPTEYVLAHAGLESGWGQREIARADGSPSFNLFGIKAGKEWQGDSTKVQTTEYRYGLPVKSVEPFRAYGGYDEAFDDYASLLTRRYPGALAATDANTFSQGLQQGGYATDPRYGEKLNRLIRQLT